MNKYTPKEAEEQTLFFQWAEMMKYQHPELAFMYHIPNGGSRNKLEAINLKKQGVKKGVPDVFLPLPLHGKHGLYIEMKRQKGSRVSNEQRDFINYLKRVNYEVCVCKGFQEAVDVTNDYLKRKD